MGHALPRLQDNSQWERNSEARQDKKMIVKHLPFMCCAGAAAAAPSVPSTCVFEPRFYFSQIFVRKSESSIGIADCTLPAVLLAAINLVIGGPERKLRAGAVAT